MLSSLLNTNQIKDAAGAEVEFSLKAEGPGPVAEYAKVGESYATPHRIGIAHAETGVGIKKRRRSRTRFDLTTISGVDNATPVTTSAILVTDTPIGALTTSDPLKMVLANLMSYLASTGADTTIKFDCTGTGAQVHINAEI